MAGVAGEQTPTHGDMLGMSDEEFSKLNEPPKVLPEAGGETTGAADQAELDAAQNAGKVDEVAKEDKAAADQAAEAAKDEEQAKLGAAKGMTLAEYKASIEGEEEDPPVEDKTDKTKTAAATEQPKLDKDGKPIQAAAAEIDPATGKPKVEAAKPEIDPKTGKPVVAVGSGEAATTTGEAPNYESLFKQIMAPFKANGKQIELKTPEEAIQLMQMGANYTRKMQDIQPHRKVLLMLENNGLLDEGKLSFLIDIEKKNPEAIKKLLKDSNIDPLEIDTSAESTYQAGNHRVADDEVGFRTVLDDLGSTAEGKQTLVDINTRWDQASKDALWKSPEIMTVIHAQRESGIYDQIVGEVERRKTLGQIPATTPFLQAYKLVGDQLQAANAFTESKPATAATATPTPVATRVATPKAAVANGEKASAASSTRSSPRKAEKFVNPLAMSDDEFLKTMANRV